MHPHIENHLGEVDAAAAADREDDGVVALPDETPHAAVDAPVLVEVRELGAGHKHLAEGAARVAQGGDEPGPQPRQVGLGVRHEEDLAVFLTVWGGWVSLCASEGSPAHPAQARVAPPPPPTPVLYRPPVNAPVAHDPLDRLLEITVRREVHRRRVVPHALAAAPRRRKGHRGV